MEKDHADGTPLGNDNLVGSATSGQIRNHAAFIWSVADLLRGDYKRSEYGRVILPLTVLRRLDGVLAPTKEQVLKRSEALPGRIDAVPLSFRQFAPTCEQFSLSETTPLI